MKLSVRTNIYDACIITISGIRIKNTHNYDFQDRGTNQFKIFTSTSSSELWTELLSNNLPYARNVADIPVLQFDLGSPITAQFVITSFDRKGGGLRFLLTYWSWKQEALRKKHSFNYIFLVLLNMNRCSPHI